MKYAYALIITTIGLSTVSANAMDVSTCAYEYTAGTIENVRNTVGYNGGQQIEDLYTSANAVCNSEFTMSSLLNRSIVRKNVDQAIADALKPTRAK